MFVKGYFDFSSSQAGIMRGNYFGAHFRLETDVSLLFPYVNAVVEGATYYSKPPYVQFQLDGINCALYPDEVILAVLNNEDQALSFVDRLIAFLNDLYDRRESITSNYKQYRPISVLDIYKLLPKTDCGECGFQTCMAFAGALRVRQTTTDKCPALTNPITEKAVYPVYDEDGNLASTIEIDIDTSEIKLNQKKREEYIETLQKKVAEITDEKHGPLRQEKPEIQTDLTNREIEVLKLIVGGASNTEISAIHAITPHTIKSHVIHIFNKLDVNDRIQAAVWETRNELVLKSYLDAIGYVFKEGQIASFIKF